MRRGVHADELRSWPVFVPLVPHAARAFCISDWHAYHLARNGDFPVPILKLGKRLMVRTSDLMREASLDPDARATS